MGFVTDSKENEPAQDAFTARNNFMHNNNPDVSTYAMNSTTSANQEYSKVLRFLVEVSKNEKSTKKVKSIKKKIDKNWEKQATSETWVLMSDAILKFAPTFIFGALVFSVVTNPNNWIIAVGVLIIFLVTLVVFALLRNKHQAEIYRVGNLQGELTEELREELIYLKSKK